MRLSKVEFKAMNNPVRRFAQKHVEFRAFKKHLQKRGIDLTGKEILDVGCGSGYSTALILKEFAPSRLIAFDFMPEQIALARKRGLPVDFAIGDATQIDAPAATFDAVFVFGVIHHIPEWRTAIAETARVLKAGGVLLIEEPNRDLVSSFGSVRRGHPEEQFDWPELIAALQESGYELLEQKTIFHGFKSFLCQKRA